MKNSGNKLTDAILRKKVEDLLKKKPIKTVSPLSEVNSMKLIHELEVRQIELEMQNEELQQARAEAQLAADKYTEIYDSAPSGYFTLSRAGKIIELNLFGSQMLGSDCSSLKNSKFDFFVSDDTRLIFNHFLKNVLAGKSKETCEVTLSIPYHSTVYVLLTGTIAENGEHCFITAIDISEQKKADEELLSERSLFRTIIDLIPDAVFVKDPDGRKILANPKEVQFSGKISEDEIIGKTDFDLFPDFFAKRALAEDLLVLKTGNPILNIEGTLIDNEGQLHHLLGSKVAIRDRHGKITGLVSLTRDITECKQAEELVALTSLRYQTLLQTASDGIHIFDIQGNIIESNARFCAMLGYSHDELLQLNVADWDTRWSKEDLIVKISELVEHPAIFETRHRRKDGSFLDVEINAACIMLAGQKVIYSSARNITERKQVEKELSLIRTKLDLALQSSGMGVWQYNLAENKRIFDNQVCSLMGIDPAKYNGSAEDFFAAIYPDDREKVRTALEETTEKHLPYQPEYRVFWPDGSIHYLSARGKLFIDEEGNPQTINGIIWDITERRQFEETLAREQYLMQMLMDQLPDHIYFKDLESRFIRINKSHARLFGFDDPGQAIGKSDFDFFSGEHAQQAYDDEQAIIRTGQPLSVEEKETYTGDRPDAWVSTVKMPLYNKDEKIIGTFGISKDITKQQTAKEEIRLKNEELEKVNAEKDKFFSLIAHDLRNPFSSFMGITALMAEELDNMSLKDIQQLATEMKKSAFNLYNLLENLLEWSRIERGLSSFDPQLFLLKPKITESMLAVLEAADKKGIQVINHVPEDLEVRSDENMLKSIFRNLANNAVKFTPKGGEVILTAKSAGNNYVEISIHDSGIGMKKEMMDQLFHLDGKTSRRGTEGEPSTGLGLILCKDFIDKHGGKIWVESEVGKGSTFYFTLPRCS